MLLIFCNTEDHIANSLYLHLKQRTQYVRIINAEELVFARSWIHQCSNNGIFDTQLILPDGYTISSENISGVFNRVRFFPTTHFIRQEDFTYAQMEFYALYASFLLSVNDKLFEKIHTHHLSLIEYDIYCMKMAIETGIPVIDNSFSSMTTSLPNNENIFVAQATRFGIKYKKWTYAVAPDSPYMSQAKTTGEYLKAIVVGDQAIIPTEIKRLEKKILSFAKKISRSFMEISFGKTTDGYKLINTNIFPAWASEDVIKMIADQLIQKLKQ
jgi:hypothetical protein